MEGFLFHYHRVLFPTALYVFSNELTPGEEFTGYSGVQYRWDSLDDAEPMRANDSRWGLRLFNAVLQLLREGYDFAIFHPDDGWILDQQLDRKRLASAWSSLEAHRIDNYRLSEDLTKTHKAEILAEDILLLENRWCHHFLTHQTSIWNLRSLLRVLERDTVSSHHEYFGSRRVIELGFRMAQFSGSPITDSIGLHWQGTGYDSTRVKRSIALGFSPEGYLPPVC